MMRILKIDTNVIFTVELTGDEIRHLAWALVIGEENVRQRSKTNSNETQVQQLRQIADNMDTLYKNLEYYDWAGDGDSGNPWNDMAKVILSERLLVEPIPTITTEEI